MKLLSLLAVCGAISVLEGSVKMNHLKREYHRAPAAAGSTEVIPRYQVIRGYDSCRARTWKARVMRIKVY